MEKKNNVKLLLQKVNEMIDEIGYMGEATIESTYNGVLTTKNDGMLFNPIDITEESEESGSDNEVNNEIDTMEQNEEKKENENEELSKELKEIESAINTFIDKHQGQVMINASFIAFDDEGEVVDDAEFMTGQKKCLIIDTEERLKDLNKIKEEWV